MQYNRRSFMTTIGSLGVAAGSPLSGSVAAECQVGAEADWRAGFPALSQRVNGYPLAYLDNAATTLRSQTVIETMTGFDTMDNANPSTRLHTLARRAASRYDAARAAAARFVNAVSPSEIVFTRGTTEGINLVAETWGSAHVERGDEILLTVAEHASNLLPWLRVANRAGATLRVVGVDDHGRLNMTELIDAMGPRTRLVAVSHVSNVLGIVNPVDEICRAARARGITVFIDGAQSAPHVPLDVGRIGCDFLAFSSHKMLGPMGVGVLWARQELLDQMPPYHLGSNMAHAAGFESAEYEHGAAKFQAGTPNVSGPIGLAAAIEVIGRIGFGALQERDRELTTHALTRLADVPGLRVLGSTDPRGRVPVIAFTMERIPVIDIVRALDVAGIAIRGGDLAAFPLLQRFGVTEAARLSLYFYNTTHEIDRCVAALTRLREERPVA